MASPHQRIQPAPPREDVLITFGDGRTSYSAPIGATLKDILASAQALGYWQAQTPIVAAICNGKLRELSYALHHDASLMPLTLNSMDGARIYRRSLVLLLTTAIAELFGAHVSVNFAIPDGGFYCEMIGRAPLNTDEIKRLEAHMRAIVAEDIPIHKQLIPLDDAIELFAARGDDDKVRLLQYRTRDTLTVYELRGRVDYYFGYMVPSTSYLSRFRLIQLEDAFILQYPRQESPDELKPVSATGKLITIFKQAEEWLARLNLQDVGSLNELTKSHNLREMILVAEALHEQNIATIASQIVQRPGLRVVFIAGPSSSGKTTFSKRLAIQLLAQGARPVTLELDSYFVERSLTPRDEAGNYDFEALGAVDLRLLNEHLPRLLAGERIVMPKFNFFDGSVTTGRTVQIGPQHIVIMEGIHGLNPSLVPSLDPAQVFRIYASALTQLNIDMHNRVPTTDVRLLRRIVRDARTRGYSATDTLNRWASVRRGEKRNIFPYQENADAMFNSALFYELAALRPLAEPLLLQVAPDTPAHVEAKRLLTFLRWVVPLLPHQIRMIPDTSLLREFIGDSILDDYHPGATQS